MSFFREKARLSAYSLLVSVYTLCAFHIPFFQHAAHCLEGGFNSVLIVGMGLVLLLGLNFLLTYFLVYCFRLVGRTLVALLLCLNAVSLYFLVDYDVLLTDEIMGCVFNTQYSEASGFFSVSLVLYFLVLGVLPSLYVMGRKLEYGSWKRLLGSIGLAVALMLAAVFGNMKNWPWVDRHSTELGSLILPWSYIVNSFRYYDGERKKDVQEILLPDVTAVSSTRDVCILMIGESARQDHFAYYGYPKPTNPYTAADGMVAFKADASATYTSAGVRAMLEAEETRELYEILPNYLQRAGVDVTWRTSNWGEPPVHTEKYYKMQDLKERYPEADSRHDGLLLAGLAEEIQGSEQDKVFVVIHGYTNHGPSYNTNYPPEFEVFTPVSSTVEMAKVSHEELLNAYDNSIVYTDWLIHQAIEAVRTSGRRGCVLYVSDHGESLGENNLYMHGVPYSMAPREQIEIPFLVWTSENLPVKKLDKVGQHHVFHSVLRFFGIESPAFNEEKCIFAEN